MKLERNLARLLGAAALGASALAVSGTAATSLLAQSPAGAAPTCVAAGTTGLTTVDDVTANNTTISGQTIDATGCDLAIYVEPGVTGVTIGGATGSDGNTISGANDTAVFLIGHRAPSRTTRSTTTESTRTGPLNRSAASSSPERPTRR